MCNALLEKKLHKILQHITSMKFVIMFCLALGFMINSSLF